MTGASGYRERAFLISESSKKRGCFASNWVPGSGVCGACGERLTGQKKWFCSEPCAKRWRLNHWYTLARPAAKKRDGHACVKCGAVKRLEVNHKIPFAGADRHKASCLNHADNLETLCKPCHKVETKRQKRAGLFRKTKIQCRSALMEPKRPRKHAIQSWRRIRRRQNREIEREIAAMDAEVDAIFATDP